MLSRGWKGILRGRQILNQGLRWRVGNEELVRVADPWAPDLKVSELIRADRQGWRLDVTSHID
ncbi:unnamed protein product [Malus baccata var. baccata]